jgi:hypothetical protein
VVQLPRRDNVRVFGDGVAVDPLTIRKALAADVAFKGSGVFVCVPPILSRLVGDVYGEIGGKG